MFTFQDISNVSDSYLEPIPDLEPVSPIVPTTTVQSAPNSLQVPQLPEVKHCLAVVAFQL